MSGMTTKKCAKCQTDKPVDQFFRKTAQPDGLASSCKECEKGHKVYPRSKRDKNRTEKRCTKCDRVKPISEFYFGKQTECYYSVCKTCHLEQTAIKTIEQKDRRNARCRNRDRSEERFRHKLDRHGITPDDYWGMMSEQKEQCVICDHKLEKPYIDHCHESGRIRGLLCTLCNKGLGLFDDNIKTLWSASSYLMNGSCPFLFFVDSAVHFRGATKKNYWRLAAFQQNCCAICGNQEKRLPRLSIDHDHGTNQVRGLLCNSCNVGLGQFQDSPFIFRKAIGYIRSHHALV